MIFAWDREKEKELLKLRGQGKSFAAIAEQLGTTVSSAKHKFLRINQKNNDERHHHPKEKIEQIQRLVTGGGGLNILELFAGWGNLTELYRLYGDVEAYDNDREKIKYIDSRGFEGVDTLKVDSFREIHRLIFHRCKYDVVDADPYGFPSRLFPHIFELIDDGWLFVTFPKMGVQQINKITVEHYRIFWGITLADKDVYVSKVLDKLRDYALFNYRVIKAYDVVDLGRMLRIAVYVKKESALDVVDLNVKGVREKEQTEEVKPKYSFNNQIEFIF